MGGAPPRAGPVGQSPSALAASEGLRERIRASAAKGFLPFDRFVELALYDPQFGYYTARTAGLGREGDFYTASHVHPLFGATLASRVHEVWHDLGAPRTFRVVELGPGDGSLAVAILQSLLPRLPPTTEFEYLLVDRSEPLLRAAAGRLEAAFGSRASGAWRVSEGLAVEGPIRGVVLANEVLDAQPFRRLVRSPGGWEELGVEAPSDGPFRWARHPLTRPIPPPALPDDAPEGSVLEISPSAEALLREVADHLAEGRAVFLDYGGEEPDLLRKGGGGSLVAIRGHRSVDPLAAPGTADLSAFVDFTRIRRVATRAGLVERSFGRQAEYLARYGLAQHLEEFVARSDPVAGVKARLAVKNLLFTFDNFWVLEVGPP
jgi:NADH dehydrogenase [ubiquinone] 1 alpha subcomplex assembly factor 7